MKASIMIAAAALALAGCAGAPEKQSAAPAAAPAATAGQANEYYVVLPEDGRIYAFGRAKDYFDYMAHGEVTLTRSRIGAGPNGKTVVFGITGDDVKQNRPSLGEQVFDGKLEGAADFHGEVFKDGRYYVFGVLKDMKAFVAFGEAPYSFTDVGAGPKGATVVWVMNKDSIKKGRPTATIERFRSLRAGK